jgi:hypothetical protein
MNYSQKRKTISIGGPLLFFSFFFFSLFCHIRNKNLYIYINKMASAISIEGVKQLSKGVHPEVIFLRLKLTGKIDLIIFDPGLILIID